MDSSIIIKTLSNKRNTYFYAQYSNSKLILATHCTVIVQRIARPFATNSTSTATNCMFTTHCTSINNALHVLIPPCEVYGVWEQSQFCNLHSLRLTVPTEDGVANMMALADLWGSLPHLQLRKVVIWGDMSLRNKLLWFHAKILGQMGSTGL